MSQLRDGSLRVGDPRMSCKFDSVKVGIVIPVRDEYSGLEELLREIHEVVADELKVTHRIVVVDDGSRDSTYKVIESLSRSSSCIKPIRLSSNRGKGLALKEGLRHANAAILIFMDGDGQHRPVDIPKLIAPLTNGTCDVVLGSRLKNGRPFNMPLRHYVSIRLATWLFNLTMKQSLKDVLCGFRAFRAGPASPTVDRANGYGVEISVLHEWISKNLSIGEVLCSTIYNERSSPGHGIRVMSQVIAETLRYP